MKTSRFAKPGVWCVIYVVACCVLTSHTVQAGDIFVSPGGDDTHAGSSRDLPLASITTAFSRAQPGDVIRLLPGTYVGKNVVRNVHGAPEFPIIITSDAEDTDDWAVIDGGAESAPDIENYGFDMTDVSWITFRNLKFRNCWMDVIVMRKARYMSFIGCDFRGGRRVIYPIGSESHHFLVENCRWEDDERVYNGVFDWTEMHHGTHRQHNGSLFAGQGIGGDFVVRYNTIKNVFNGIRFNGDKGARRQNANGEIYGNLIMNTRDNAFEPEDNCSNVHFYHNRIVNSHAAISIDMITGGPIYIYGNVGWQTENLGHEWTIFKSRGLEPGQPNAFLDEPLYVFHNSWFVYHEAVGRDTPKWENRHMKHFNNAYYFMNGNNLGVHNWGEGYEFDYTCSNTPIPQNVLAHGGEAHAIKADPMFVNMQEGDFHLRDGSPCRDAGRILEGFTQHFEGSAPDIGAYEGDRLVEGPPFRFQEPPGGAYYREKPRIVRHRIADNTLTLFFSLALDAATVQRDAITLFQGDRAIPISHLSLQDAGYALVVTTSHPISDQELSLYFTTLPIGVNGERATHWASTVRIAPQ